MKPILRPYQDELERDARAAFAFGAKRVCVVSPTGSGKCLGKGTPVLMYDGSVKAVENVLVGDFLMGPDSNPRRVESVARGREMMYQIIPTKGMPFTVNESHILSLKMTGFKHGVNCGAVYFTGGDVVNVAVPTYLGSNKTFKHVSKLWRVPIDFKSQETHKYLPPYLLGMWLGDGFSRHPAFSFKDEELISALLWYAVDLGTMLRQERVAGKCLNFHMTMGNGGGKNPVRDALKHYGLIQNKHVPDAYKINSKEVRLELLAGLLDTDGHLSTGGFDYISKVESISDDVCFIARSLGLAAYKTKCRKMCGQNGVWGDYYRVSISGDVSIIPCRLPRKQASPRRQKKNVLMTGFSINPIGVGDYFGFSISGSDRLFLLGDFTVTHNTITLCSIVANAQSKGKRVICTVPRETIFNQMSAALDSFGIEHGAIAAGNPMNQMKSVQLASAYTLAKRLGIVIKPDLIVFDECHLSLAATWGKVIEAWPDVPVIGFTASPERLDGKGLGEVFDKMVLGREMQWHMDQGYLTRPRYFTHAVPEFDRSTAKVQGGDFRTEDMDCYDKPKIIGDMVSHYRRHADGLKAVAFCKSRAHADALAEQFRSAGYTSQAIYGQGMTDAMREQRLAALANGSLQVLTSCDLIGMGYDLPAIECVILARPTASLARYLQWVGRGNRPVYAQGCDLSTQSGRLAAIASGPKQRFIVLDHGGNVRPGHGKAEDLRMWSLEGARKRKAMEQEPTFKTRECPQCFATVSSATFICEECGYDFRTSRADRDAVPRVHDGQLVMLKDSESDGEFMRCLQCGKVHHVTLSACPGCGLDYEKIRDEQEMAKRKKERQQEGWITSKMGLMELAAYGAKKGYRCPAEWARKVIESRGRKAA